MVSDALYRRWARLVGAEDWIDDPRFATDELRGQHNDLLSEKSAAWAARLTTTEALDLLGEAKIPAGPVLTPQTILEDPHITAAHYFRPRDYPGLPAPAPIVEPGARFSELTLPTRRPPTIGEHTDEILASLGYTAGEISELRAKGVI